MSSMKKKLVTMSTILALATPATIPVTAYAALQEKAPIEIKVHVNEKGFFDEKGKAFNAKNMLKVPSGNRVTITFIFAEDLTSLAVGDTHQMAIRSEDGWKLETGQIWIMNRQSSITFLAGENSRTQYRVYCILDCIGMEHLTNLLIQTV